MDSFEMFARRSLWSHPIFILALSILFFLLCDTIIFRSGFYQRYILSRYWSPGSIFHIIDDDAQRTPSPDTDVLLMGNSLIDVGFSLTQFKSEHPNLKVNFVNVAVSGTHEKTWYYMLKRLDPTRSRYKAVIIPLNSYIIKSNSFDEENRFQAALDCLALLKPSDWSSFIESFRSPEMRMRVAMVIAFPSHAYSVDLQNFLLAPVRRLNDLEDMRRSRLTWRSDTMGAKSPSLEGLEIDPDTGKIRSFPPDVDYWTRRTLIEDTQQRPVAEIASSTFKNAQFAKNWLTKIDEFYAGTVTQIVYVQMPRWPLPFIGSKPMENAPDVRNMLPTASNVRFMPEDLFYNIEKPKYFFDTEHLDSRGRTEFTRVFGNALADMLASGSLKPTITTDTVDKNVQ